MVCPGSRGGVGQCCCCMDHAVEYVLAAPATRLAPCVDDPPRTVDRTGSAHQTWTLDEVGEAVGLT